MAYRKGYFKKDGTYVQGHFTNHHRRSYKGGNGCMILIVPALLMLLFYVL
ncbi:MULTISPECIES: hypothetical protein [unclassified Flavobacterium]|nr:hypothetical protein [Flavobacterium sp.]